MDFLRLLGAVLVLFGHSFALTGAVGPSFAGDGVQTIGVKIFFSISGYLIVKSWLNDPSPLRFVTRRMLRILPGLTAIVLVTAFVIGPIFTTLELSNYLTHPTTYDYCRNIIFDIRYALPGVFDATIYPSAVNGSLWSLPIEVLMYVIVPAYIAASKALIPNLWRHAFFAFTVCVCVINILVVKTGTRPEPLIIYNSNVWYVVELGPYFLIGGCIAALKLEVFLDTGMGLAAILILALFQLSQPFQEIILYVVLPYACMALGLKSTLILRGAGYFGDLSYGIFLAGFPAQQMVVATFGDWGGPWFNFAAALFMSTMIAFCIWHFIEKHALARKPASR